MLKVQTDTPALQAQRGDAGGNSYHEVPLRYLGGWPKGKRAGKLVVTTDDPRAPRLEVPYEVSIHQANRLPPQRRERAPFTGAVIRHRPKPVTCPRGSRGERDGNRYASPRDPTTPR